MRRTPRARLLTAAAAASLVGGLLAGCTGAPFATECTPGIAAGDASTAVSASGEVGSSPSVDFPTPLLSPTPERSVVTTGEGEVVAEGAVVFADLVYYDAATGDSIGDTTTLVTASGAGLAVGESLVCATIGSRVVVTGPAEELDTNFSGATDTVVAVLDLREAYLGKANGVNQLPVDGMPTVVTAVDGAPGLALGYQSEVDESRTATIKAGAGAVVEEGDTIVFHARSFTWSAGASEANVGDIDSWSRSVPYRLEPTVDTMGDQNLVDALVGAKVGSQVLLVVPSEEGGATAYVFDILGIAQD